MASVRRHPADSVSRKWSGKLPPRETPAAGMAALALALNPSEYEPTHASFLVHARSPLRLYPGSSGSTFLMVPNKTASQVHFALHRVPQEFEIELVGAVRSPESTAWVSLQATAKAGTRPGRYYIAVDATCQGETETAEVVIDVIARAAPGMTPTKIPNPPHRAAGRL